MSSLIQSLPDGPLDVIGDVHGEIDALRQLLRHLGYDDDGVHPTGRRLVFVGDLVNRGPNSPAVVEWVRHLVQFQRAHCLLGNHELNILIGVKRPVSQWFYGESRMDDTGQPIPQTLADESMRYQMRQWFQTLPVALVRYDLRIVHACWDADMIELAKGQGDVRKLFESSRRQIESELDGCEDEVERYLAHRNRNPVLRLTAGFLERSDSRSQETGKMRFTQQRPWWLQYADPEYCVFGHYSHLDGVFLGSRSSLCIDFGVGKRWTERRMGVTRSFTWKLAAFRHPEKELVFDDGNRQPIS